jgi:drug/metabolite transporter (DMT)-like permease
VLLLVGVLTAVAYGALYQGLMLGPIVLVGPIASAYAVGPTVLAVVVLGERLSTTEAVGAAAAIVGVVVVSSGQTSTAPQAPASGRTGVPFAFVAMVSFSLSAFMIAASAQRMGWLPPLLISRVGVFLSLVPAAFFLTRASLLEPQERQDRSSIYVAALAGCCNIAGTAVYAHAAQLEQVALVSAVSALFPLVPVIGGFALFHERMSLIQMVGIGVILVGLVLLR